MARRIAVINTVACNGGDAAILSAIVDQVRSIWPNCVVTAYDTQADAAARHHRFVSFDTGVHAALARSPIRRMRWLLAARLRGRGHTRAAGRIVHPADRRRLARLARSDVIISTGGTYLIEQYDLRPRFLEFLGIRLLRRPLVLYTQTLGHFKTSAMRRGMRRVLESARLLFIRDETSRSIALELGANANHTFVVPDVVWSGEVNGAVERLRTARVSAEPRIALSVRDLLPFVRATPGSRRAYEQAIAELVTFLVRQRSAHVDFLSTCQGIAEYRFDDARVAHAIVRLLPDDVKRRVRVIDGQHSARQLRAAYAECDAVVATRMHAAILALSSGTPVLPIPYERKINELYRDLEAGFTIVDATVASGPALIASWCEFEAELPRWRAVAARRIEEWQTAAQRPAVEMRRLFG